MERNHVKPATDPASHDAPQTPRHWRVAGLVAGALAALWFLVRVVPRPSRAAYPCQRAAAPAAFGFLAWFFWGTAAVGIGGALRHRVRRAVGPALLVLAGSGGVLAIIAACKSSTAAPPASSVYTPPDGPNHPMGVARGTNPGRVAWVHDRRATSWDGTTGHWWSDESTNQAAVDAMMSKGLRWLIGSSADADAWAEIFRYFNRTHGRGDVGYAPGETIAVKINMNNTLKQDDEDNQIDASPHMVLALLGQLITKAGIPADKVTVYDASSTVDPEHPTWGGLRRIPDRVYNKCNALYPGVNWVDSSGGNGRTATGWVTGRIHYSDALVRDDKGSMDLSTAATSATYLINFAILKGHEGQGVTLTGKNHYGSIRNVNHLGTLGGESPAYNVFVDFMGHKDLGGKTVLFLIDGLYGSYTAAGTPRKWNMPPFGDGTVGYWPSSLFLSQDGVAIDSVGWDFIHTEWSTMPDLRHSDLYLHEAAQAANPRSKTAYDPEGDGTTIESLGIHEHWNNATFMQYSKNILATAEGIELVAAAPPLREAGALGPDADAATTEDADAAGVEDADAAVDAAEEGDF
jgi:hypothetical protein